MSTTSPYYFVSYSRRDLQQVEYILDALRQYDLDFWTDNNLTPGVSWEQEIMNAIRGASGLLVFLSPNSVNSKWVFSEIAAAQSSGMIVFPVLLDRSTEIPLRLLNLQYMDMSNPDALKRGIASLSDFLLANLSILKKSTQQPSDIIVNTFAHNLAEQARTAGISESTDINTTTHNSPPESVFIVHGRDIPFRDEVENQ